MNRTFRHPLIITILCCFILLGTSGCGTINGWFKSDYDEALEESVAYNITDREVAEFTNHVRHMLRKKMKWASVAAYVSSTFSLATAAAAATVGVTSNGGQSVIRAVAALSAGSLFTNDLIGIFKMRDRAQAYQDGLALMETAESRYIQAMAKHNNGKVEQFKISTYGADYYSETIGALRLVERALVNAIPTLAEVKQATGVHSDLRVSSQSVTLSEANKNTDILVLKNGPVVGVASSHPDLVSAAHNGAVIDIRGQEGLFVASASEQKIKVTAVSAQGQSVEILVNAETGGASGKKLDPEKLPVLSKASHNVMVVRRADVGLDGQLSPTGEKQADELEADLRTLNVTHVYVMKTCGVIQTVNPLLKRSENKLIVKEFKISGSEDFKDIASDCEDKMTLGERFQKLKDRPDLSDTSTLVSLQWLLKDIESNKPGETSLIVHDDHWEPLLASAEGFSTGFPDGWPSAEVVTNRHDILVHLATKAGKAGSIKFHDYFKDKGPKLGFASGPLTKKINELQSGISLKLNTKVVLGASGRKIKFIRKEAGQNIKNDQLKILFPKSDTQRNFGLGEDIEVNDISKEKKLEIILQSFTPIEPPFNKNETITLELVGGEFIDEEKSTITLTIQPIP